MDILRPRDPQDNPVKPEKKYQPIYGLDILTKKVVKPAPPEKPIPEIVPVTPEEPVQVVAKKKYDLAKLPAKKLCPDCKEEREITLFLTRTLSLMYPCCRECMRKRNRGRYTPEIGMANNLREFYGISLDEYDQMCLDQDDLCACCGEPEKTINRRTGEVQRLSVDHDHKTGHVRGLLCNHCNLEVARIESGKRRKLAMTYLEKCNKD